MADSETDTLRDLVGGELAREITKARIMSIVREKPGITIADLTAEMIRRKWLAADVTAEDVTFLEPTDTLHPASNQRHGNA